jgi:hypothetical protein
MTPNFKKLAWEKAEFPTMPDGNVLRWSLRIALLRDEIGAG